MARPPTQHLLVRGRCLGLEPQAEVGGAQVQPRVEVLWISGQRRLQLGGELFALLTRRQRGDEVPSRPGIIRIRLQHRLQLHLRLGDVAAVEQQLTVSAARLDVFGIDLYQVPVPLAGGRQPGLAVQRGDSPQSQRVVGPPVESGRQHPPRRRHLAGREHRRGHEPPHLGDGRIDHQRMAQELQRASRPRLAGRGRPPHAAATMKRAHRPAIKRERVRVVPERRPRRFESPGRNGHIRHRRKCRRRRLESEGRHRFPRSGARRAGHHGVRSRTPHVDGHRHLSVCLRWQRRPAPTTERKLGTARENSSSRPTKRKGAARANRSATIAGSP